MKTVFRSFKTKADDGTSNKWFLTLIDETVIIIQRILSKEIWEGFELKRKIKGYYYQEREIFLKQTSFHGLIGMYNLFLHEQTKQENLEEVMEKTIKGNSNISYTYTSIINKVEK